MLRQKYSKKKRREKMKKNKKTRKIGGMKTRANTGSRSRRRKRQIEEEATRLSSRVPQQQQQSKTMSPRDERDAQARFAALLGEKCEATKQVNDDGSIDCPSSRTKAKKKFNKFHPDKNPGCKDYAKNMMNKYNETCYGDDTNPNRKWDKNDSTWRNEEAERDGFYTTKMDDSSESAGASKSVFDHCTAKDKKSPICRVCGWTNDPNAKEKCLCCPDSPQAKDAAAKAAAAAEAAAPETVQRSPVVQPKNNRGFIEPPLTNSMSEMDEIINQRLGDNKTTPIKCRKGDKSEECVGKKGAKKKKAERQKCKRSGGKVINKNTRDEACVELMEMPSSGSENRGRLPVSPTSIKDRAKNLEKQLTTPEPQPEQSITMATNQCAEVREGATTYFAEVEDGSYTGNVAASLKDPMCKPELPAGWESYFHETYNTYFYINTINGQPQWEFPTLPAAETPSAPSSDDPSAPPLDVPDLRQGSVPIYTGLTDNNQCALMKSEDGQEYVAEVDDNDNDGHVDYTGKTAYSPSDPICNKPPPNGWEMITDTASGQIYYYNSTTGQSSWTYPESTESSESAPATAAESPSTPESSEPAPATAKEDESKNKILDKTHGSCRYAKTPEGKEYLYNFENQTTWDKDSPICHLKDTTVFGLNYRLTFAKVLHKSGIRV